ncbi:MAG: flagellar hook-associated protein 3 [Firmicutes bacterium]|nr:flagellar hook-associated protein 3 [Bacillota bacterium]
MRITNMYLSNHILNSMQKNLSGLARTEEQLATSKSLLRASDKPIMMGQFMSIKSTLSYNEQYNRNLDDGLSFLDMTDSTMGTMGNVLTKAKELALQGSNDTYNSEDRKAVAAQIDKLIDQIVDLGNSTVGGKYIYAGTKNGASPFERDGDKIIFKGNTNQVTREVLAGTDYTIGQPGITKGWNIIANNVEAKSINELPQVTERPTDHSKIGVINLKYDSTATPPFGQIEGFNLDGNTPNSNLVIYTDAANPGYSYDTATETLEITDGDLAGLKIEMPTELKDGAEYNVTLDNELGVFGNGKWDNNAYVIYDGSDPAHDYATKDSVDKGIFDALFNLRNLLNDDSQSDFGDKMQQSIGDLEGKIDQLLRHRVAVGARTKHFETLKDQLLDQEVKLTENLEKIEGADMAKLSIQASQQQLSYNASLAVGAKIMQTSLLNFLR